MRRATPSGGGCHSSDALLATVGDGDATPVYEQVFATILTLVTLKVGIDDEPIEPEPVEPEAVVPELVVPELVVPVPVVPVVPVVPAVPAVLPGVVPVEPELVMLELESIVPVTSTFWFTYWLRLTLDPEAFSRSVLCAPIALEPVLPLAPVVPVAPVAPVVPVVLPEAELPEPLSILVSMN